MTREAVSRPVNSYDLFEDCIELFGDWETGRQIIV